MNAHPTPRIPTWQLTARVARYRLGLFAATAALLAASNALLLGIGLILRWIFDALSGAAPAGLGVFPLIGVLVAAEVTRMAVVWGGVVWTPCWEYMSGLLRLNLLRAQMQSGGPEAGTVLTSSGGAVSHVRDDTDDFLRLLDTATWVAGRVLFAIGAAILMLRIDPVVAVAVALPLAAMVIAVQVVGERIRTYRRATRTVTTAITAFLGEIFGAALTIKAANAAQAVLRRSTVLNQDRRRAAVRDELLAQVLSAFNTTTVDLGVGLVLLLASSAMYRGDFTVGDLVLFVSYTNTLAAIPYYGGRMLVRYRQAGVAVERLTPLLPASSPSALVASRPLYVSDRQPPATVPTTSSGTAPLQTLDIRGLCATHPTTGRGIRDIDLCLERGSFTVISGPVGAGKTTLLRAMLGLMPSEGGTVTWNGQRVTDLAAFMIPPRTAYVPQVPHLFSESVADNLLLGSDPDAVDLDGALRTAVLTDDLRTMPDGLATSLGARGVRLSGGQAQRAAIARAVTRRPDLLVLDDVSSALDVHTERDLWDRLVNDTRATLLVVSNRPATLARADQVITLDHRHIRHTPQAPEPPAAAGRVRQVPSADMREAPPMKPL
jgi:ATP-binding cassette, subfamily B, bacterial